MVKLGKMFAFSRDGNFTFTKLLQYQPEVSSVMKVWVWNRAKP